MSPFALLWPTFAMAAVLFAAWVALTARRAALIRRPPAPDDVGFDAAAQDPADPSGTPVLFFALAPLLLMFRQAGIAQVLLAWLFVAARAMHNVVHLGRDDVRTRFRLFILSTAILSAMWIGFFVDIIIAWRGYHEATASLADLLAQP